MIIRQCLICKKEFLTKPSTIKKGNGKYCSKKCCNISKKELTPWIKGKHHSIKTRRKMSKNHANFSSEKHPQWKGENAGYYGKHSWINRCKGKATKCKHCGKIGSGHKIHWANIDHKYSRNPDDYISLCAKCHQEYDIKYNNYLSPVINCL